MEQATEVKKVDLSTTTVLVIEPAKEMQRLLRAMLANFGIRDVRVFGNSAEASSAVLADPPSLIMLDWESVPHNGASILKLFRHQNMYPACLVPIIVVVSPARQRSIERAMRLGAHAVVAKPLAPLVLADRIRWVLSGEQRLRLVGERYVIAGVKERLNEQKERQSQMEAAKAYQQSQFAEMESIQSDVDRLLESSF